MFTLEERLASLEEALKAREEAEKAGGYTPDKDVQD
jgi:hypothetical protein